MSSRFRCFDCLSRSGRKTWRAMTGVVPGWRWSRRIRWQAVGLFYRRRSFSDGSGPSKRRWAARCPSGNERVDLIRRGLVAAVAEHRQHVERDQLLHQFLTARGVLDRSLNLGPRDTEEPHKHFPVVRNEQIELSSEMTAQRGA